MEILTVTTKYDSQAYKVSVEHNKSIRIECTYKNAHNPKPTDVTFNIGDKAEYDSYNLKYLGVITGITTKTITFEVGTSRQPETKRLKIADFCSLFQQIRKKKWQL
jgi:hypothetical protein